jgi:hypothetical protein
MQESDAPGIAGNPPPPVEHGRADQHPDKLSWWRDRHFWIQIAIFLVGCYVACIYSRQLREMVKSNKINREALESVQRAFITLKSSHLSDPYFVKTLTGEERWLAVDINWENSGVTPATPAKSYWSLDVIPDAKFESLEFFKPLDNIHFDQFVIGPKDVVQAGSIRKKESQIISPPAGARLAIWGWNVYRDIFASGKPHLTEFCYSLTSVIKRTSGDSSKPPSYEMDLTTCPKHNCTDETCDDYKEITEFANER